MNFEEAVAFLDARIRHGMRPGLERIAALVELLDHPQRTYPSIHVTGTNGKYSVAAMATAILGELGLTVGTYVSPHVETVRERIAVGREPIDPESFAAVLSYLAPYMELVGDSLTYFEALTAMAFEHFFDLAVHAAVVEVGLGGEYDATNVLDARVAVITKITRDHVREFGDLATAAWEKAGVIKRDAVVVSGVAEPSLAAVIEERARERGASRVARHGEDFGVLERRMAVGGQVVGIRGLESSYEDVFLPAYGEHQAANAAFAVAACEAFGGGGLDGAGVAAALGSVSLPGRLEVVSRHPVVVLDGGHNPDAAGAVVRSLREEFAYRRLICVVGMLDDKAVEEVLGIVSQAADRFVVTAPAADRAAPVDRLERALSGRPVAVVAGVEGAVGAALDEADEDDLVLVFGSFYTVGEARPFLRRMARVPQS